jgi:Flp pilus assembly protein TadG
MSRQTPIPHWTTIRRAIRRFMVGEHGIAGSALVEFTLFAPLLVIMSIYTIDYGLVFFRNMDVQDAAQAGVDWAIANGVYNCTAMRSAATNSTTYTAISLPGSCPNNPIEQCGCPSSTGVTFTTYSGASCPACGSSAGGLYVTVQTQATYTTLAPYGLTSNPYTLTAQATARIQ